MCSPVVLASFPTNESNRDTITFAFSHEKSFRSFFTSINTAAVTLSTPEGSFFKPLNSFMSSAVKASTASFASSRKGSALAKSPAACVCRLRASLECSSAFSRSEAPASLAASAAALLLPISRSTSSAACLLDSTSTCLNSSSSFRLSTASAVFASVADPSSSLSMSRPTFEECVRNRCAKLSMSSRKEAGGAYAKRFSLARKRVEASWTPQ
mmetsp:Transcript_34196/g.62543  ORF Transcript_34196/g.62543 Transcript_34196/m.62543 type:complete len:212 (-) Transcript_34196:290-925(-)